MKKQQTAVEWLIQEWPILEAQLPIWLIEQAKQMEKEQIINAHLCMDIDGYFYQDREDGEIYYEETFKSE